MPSNMQRVTTPFINAPFIADPHSVDRDSGRQIDWANVGDAYRDNVVVVTIGGTEAIDDTSLGVTALTGPIPAGTVLAFGGKKFATTTAAVAAGATALPVAAIPTALAAADVAYYFPEGSKKRLKAGTVVGTLLGSGKVSPRIVTTNPAIGILETDAVQDQLEAALTGYGVLLGGVIYENLLPGGAPAGAIKTELAAAGTGFSYQTYGDNRS